MKANVDDINTSGYWTSSPAPFASKYVELMYIHFFDSLYNYDYMPLTREGLPIGLRPVIVVKK